MSILLTVVLFLTACSQITATAAPQPAHSVPASVQRAINGLNRSETTAVFEPVDGAETLSAQIGGDLSLEASAEMDEPTSIPETSDVTETPERGERSGTAPEPTEDVDEEVEPTEALEPTEESEPTDDAEPADDAEPTDDAEPADESAPADDAEPTDESAPGDAASAQDGAPADDASATEGTESDGDEDQPVEEGSGSLDDQDSAAQPDDSVTALDDPRSSVSEWCATSAAAYEELLVDVTPMLLIVDENLVESTLGSALPRFDEYAEVAPAEYARSTAVLAASYRSLYERYRVPAPTEGSAPIIVFLEDDAVAAFMEMRSFHASTCGVVVDYGSLLDVAAVDEFVTTREFFVMFEFLFAEVFTPTQAECIANVMAISDDLEVLLPRYCGLSADQVLNAFD